MKNLKNKAFLFRAYLTSEQKKQVDITLNIVHYVYNYYLGLRQERESQIKKEKEEKGTSKLKHLNYHDCCNDLKRLKEEKPWIKEASAVAIQQELRHQDTAYKNFFRNLKKGIKNPGYPKFKSRHKNEYSYTIVQTAKYENGKIYLPKIGWIKVKNKQIPVGRILNATVSRKPTGKYYISLICENVNINVFDKTGEYIAFDLGLSDFAISSNGIKIPNPHFLKESFEKLAKAQIKLSRKPNGSKNREKARKQVAKIHEKIANIRKDFLQKLSTEIVKKYDIICTEKLNIKNLMKNHILAQAISDVSWGSFLQMLKYKCEWNDKQFIQIDRFYASSQICSDCGEVNKNLKGFEALSIREWTCPNCGNYHDRDINAAKNILKKGLESINI